MILPRAPEKYDQRNEQQTRDAIERDARETFYKGRDVELARGERLIMPDTNGVRYVITVNTSGVLVATAL